MINHVYQLISPRVISIRFEDIQFADKVLVSRNIWLCVMQISDIIKDFEIRRH